LKLQDVLDNDNVYCVENFATEVKNLKFLWFIRNFTCC